MEQKDTQRTDFRKISFLVVLLKYVYISDFGQNWTKVADILHEDIRTFMISRQDWSA